MALDAKDVAKDIQARIDMPPPVHVRNINVDTHEGVAPQRPYALLEDHMATITNGYPSVEALKAALKNAPEPADLPKGAPNPNDLVEYQGGLVRLVPSSDFRETVIVDGVAKERVRFVRRAVSLTMDGARIASQNGVETDYWNGFTWLRNGFKPERDFAVMAHQSALGASEDLVFDLDASPSSEAVLRHQVARLDANRPPVPVERTKSSRKED